MLGSHCVVLNNKLDREISLKTKTTLWGLSCTVQDGLLVYNQHVLDQVLFYTLVLLVKWAEPVH